jgi:L-ascorbate metabolism protein UlaG (beta-lactamase superfamily)
MLIRWDGGGPTVGGEPAAAVVRALRPRLVVPMHYRSEAVNFLDPPDAFLDALDADERAVALLAAPTLERDEAVQRQ